MRAVTLSSCILLSVLPASFAHPYPAGNRPSHTFGNPANPPSVSSTPIGTPATQPATQTGGSPVSVQSVVASGLTASATGSSPGAQSSASSSKSTGSTPAKGVIYNAGTAQRAISLAPAWACDWDVTPDTSNYKFQYVPQLWGPTHTITTADVAISDYVLFYNEPDNCAGTGGSCVGVNQTISDFNSKLKPFQAAGKKVSTPCVENPSTSYMETFLQAFSKGSIDILCFHWYGNDLAGLQSTVQAFKGIQQTYQVGQIWISEMGVNSNPSDVSQYTNYLDGAVDRYAYNLYNLGAGGTI